MIKSQKIAWILERYFEGEGWQGLLLANPNNLYREYYQRVYDEEKSFFPNDPIRIKAFVSHTPPPLTVGEIP